MKDFKCISVVRYTILVIFVARTDGYPAKVLTPSAVVHGEGLKIGYVNLPNKVFVDSMIDGSSDVSMLIYGPGVTKFGTVNCADGRCEFNYYPQSTGDHYVTIHFNGNVIGQNSRKVPVEKYLSRNPNDDPRIDDMRCNFRPNEYQTQAVLMNSMEGKEYTEGIYTTSITVRSIGKVNTTMAKVIMQKVIAIRTDSPLFRISFASPTVFIPIVFVALLLGLHLFVNPTNEMNEYGEDEEKLFDICNSDSNENNSDGNYNINDVTILTEDYSYYENDDIEILTE